MANITFYSADEDVAEWTIKPVPSSKSIPSWYKIIDNNNSYSESTIKRCMAVFDSMTAGYTIYFPCDIYIDATKENIEASVPYLTEQKNLNVIGMHSSSQYSNYPIGNQYHKDILRVDPLWYVMTEPGYSSFFINPVHGDGTPFETMSGVIDTDAYISKGSLSIFIKKGFKGVIKQGTPLVQVIPFKREEFSMSIGTQEDYRKRLSNQIKFFIPKFYGAYKSSLRSIKKYV